MLRPPDVSVVSSWTIATPTVRRTSENHFADESECLKNRIEKMAVVRSLSCAIFFDAHWASQRRVVAVHAEWTTDLIGRLIRCGVEVRQGDILCGSSCQ